jgi:hypothetical protein
VTPPSRPSNAVRPLLARDGGRTVLALGLYLPAALVVAAVLMLLSCDGRRDVDLRAWVEADDPWSRSVMPHARWATDELCGEGRMPCIQAVTSDTLTMYRFEERMYAEALAERLGEDAYLSGWIVVRFEPGGLPPGDRYGFEYGVGCINTWVSEDGRDC